MHLVTWSYVKKPVSEVISDWSRHNSSDMVLVNYGLQRGRSNRSFCPQFLSYLLKRFIHLCRALYVDTILVHHFGVPLWSPEINKNIWS